jgi:hypothetical protein
VSTGRDPSGRYRQHSERLRGTYTDAKARARQLEERYATIPGHQKVDMTLAEALALYIGQHSGELRMRGPLTSRS